MDHDNEDNYYHRDDAAVRACACVCMCVYVCTCVLGQGKVRWAAPRVLRVLYVVLCTLWSAWMAVECRVHNVLGLLQHRRQQSGSSHRSIELPPLPLPLVFL